MPNGGGKSVYIYYLEQSCYSNSFYQVSISHPFYTYYFYFLFVFHFTFMNHFNIPNFILTRIYRIICLEMAQAIMQFVHGEINHETTGLSLKSLSYLSIVPNVLSPTKSSPCKLILLCPFLTSDILINHFCVLSAKYKTGTVGIILG